MSMKGALAGVRVIDASSYLTGPFAAMLLADLGADVHKVEPPRGDPFRRVGRRHGDTAISFANVNRNKRSITLDLRDRADREAFNTLLADSDVLITNWRPATTQEFGFDERLVDIHPSAGVGSYQWVRAGGSRRQCTGVRCDPSGLERAWRGRRAMGLLRPSCDRGCATK